MFWWLNLLQGQKCRRKIGHFFSLANYIMLHYVNPCQKVTGVLGDCRVNNCLFRPILFSAQAQRAAWRMKGWVLSDPFRVHPVNASHLMIKASMRKSSSSCSEQTSGSVCRTRQRKQTGAQHLFWRRARWERGRGTDLDRHLQRAGFPWYSHCQSFIDFPESTVAQTPGSTRGSSHSLHLCLNWKAWVGNAKILKEFDSAEPEQWKIIWIWLGIRHFD